ncbi:MAG: helix-turn-helix domain-containing protein [Candidatus Woesearchaeota archaeon]|nr:helix-turn-helix domain-containing protein [Candidatus Woesearchaeota archaeon]
MLITPTLMEEMRPMVYYHAKTETIKEFFPANTDATKKGQIMTMWAQEIPRKILMQLSQKSQMSVPELKHAIGHSMSTLHETLKKLEEAELITTKMIYEGKKQKVITPNVLFVHKSADVRAKMEKFFQGLWVDSRTTMKIVDFLNQNATKFYTAEEIALQTDIPLERVELLLNNWDSFITRTVSSAFQRCPFEKKVVYRGRD